MAHITISDGSPRQTFSVGVATQRFTISFPVFSDRDIRVWSNGAELYRVTDWTFSGVAGTDGGYLGGTISTISTISGATVEIVRDIPIDRLTDFPAGMGFNVTALNTHLDRMTAQMQQLDEGLRRVPHQPIYEATVSMTLPPAATRAGRVMGFDLAGSVSTSQATMSLLDGLAVGAEIGGGVVAHFGPVTSDGSLQAVDTGYPLLREDRVKVCLGGIWQANTAFTISGNTISFAAAVPNGVTVYGEIQGITSTFSTIPVNTFWNATLSTSTASEARAALGAGTLSAVTFSAGAGLSGGGTLSSSGIITLSATFSAATINAGNGLTGGGTLSGAGSSVTLSATFSSATISAGAGLAGGGTISGSNSVVSFSLSSLALLTLSMVSPTADAVPFFNTGYSASTFSVGAPMRASMGGATMSAVRATMSVANHEVYEKIPLGTMSGTISGTGLVTMYWDTPYALTLTQTPNFAVRNASTSGNPTVDIWYSGASIFGANKLSIDASELTSATAATPATQSTMSFPALARLTFSVTVSGAGATGPVVTIWFRRNG